MDSTSFLMLFPVFIKIGYIKSLVSKVSSLFKDLKDLVLRKRAGLFFILFLLSTDTFSYF